MNTQHTPGPWWMAATFTSTTTPDNYAVGAGDEVLAHGIKSRADALAMKAAPEMLAALEGLLKMVEAVLTDSQLDHDLCGRTIRNAIGPTRAAIAKAKGEA